MKQIIHSFLYGSAVWAACTVSQEVKAGGIPVSTTEDGDAVSPNIVCVVCEDIGPWLHCFGDSVAVTPTIDALAAEGIRYTSIYGTVGVSAPSRAALITGMYPTHINANYMHTQGGADCTSTGGNRLRYCVTRGNKVLYRAVTCRWLLLYEQPENRLSVSSAFDRLGRMWQAGALAQPS